MDQSPNITTKALEWYQANSNSPKTNYDSSSKSNRTYALAKSGAKAGVGYASNMAKKVASNYVTGPVKVALLLAGGVAAAYAAHEYLGVLPDGVHTGNAITDSMINQPLTVAHDAVKTVVDGATNKVTSVWDAEVKFFGGYAESPSLPRTGTGETVSHDSIINSAVANTEKNGLSQNMVNLLKQQGYTPQDIANIQAGGISHDEARDAVKALDTYFEGSMKPVIDGKDVAKAIDTVKSTPHDQYILDAHPEYNIYNPTYLDKVDSQGALLAGAVDVAGAATIVGGAALLNKELNKRRAAEAGY